jgi:hypothetical protein
MNSMKNYFGPGLWLFCFSVLLTSCYTPFPEKYFDIAVLNSNTLVGFANGGMLSELESPMVKVAAGTGKPSAMKRGEIIANKIQIAEDNLKKVKSLKETGDTRDMLQTSVALYEYVLPVYKIEYTQLAALYDKRASKKLIQSLAQGIHDKYYTGYNELYTRLIKIGKSYAQKHGIKVNW